MHRRAWLLRSAQATRFALENAASIAAHKALGFADETPTVRFRKWLPGTAGGEHRAARGQD